MKYRPRVKFVDLWLSEVALRGVQELSSRSVIQLFNVISPPGFRRRRSRRCRRGRRRTSSGCSRTPTSPASTPKGSPSCRGTCRSPEGSEARETPLDTTKSSAQVSATKRAISLGDLGSCSVSCLVCLLPYLSANAPQVIHTVNP